MLRGSALLFAAALLLPVDVDGQVLSKAEVRDIMVATYDTLRTHFRAEGTAYLDPEPYPPVPRDWLDGGIRIREDSSGTGPSIELPDIEAVSDRLGLPVASREGLMVCEPEKFPTCRFRTDVTGVLQFGEIFSSEEGVLLIARVSWSTLGPSGYGFAPTSWRSLRISLRPMPDGEWRVERMATLTWAG